MKFDGFNYRFSLGFLGAVLLFAAFGLPFFSQAQTQQNQNARPRQAAAPTPTPSVRQTPPTMSTPVPQPSPKKEEEVVDETDGVLRADTELVSLSVRVVDRNGRVQGDVKPEEFKVFENGALQKLDFVSKEEVPVNYGLLIDNSGSLRSQLEKVIEAGKILVNANKPEDETFIIRFVSSDKVELKQDFTADKNLLNETLDELYVEGGQTAVIDAVMLGAEKASEYEKSRNPEERKRRALILVTDGEDRASFYKEEQLFARLREADVQIYVIGFVNELETEKGLFGKSGRGKAVAFLERMAKETGGKTYFPNAVSELPQIARDINNEIRTQYILSYAPTNDKRDGSYRAVRVQVADDSKRGKRIALTRAGYTARKD
ncbi:MAG TPA: VWA domain-containing protein [Pyrinomonadaceae bacterium]|nr:VWA domain-containing protein [Pyrinomonadaceae bacterium]